LNEFKPKAENKGDYTKKELQEMDAKIQSELTMTERIMEEVVQRCKNRNGVLITCAGKEHCKQVAQCLPKGAWGIVTDQTPTNKRREILRKAKSGELKYVIQVGCLTTGINVPVWDVCVILRRIGSLTLLTQLIGRVLRTLKQEHIDAGFEKSDALVLDYTDTFESMGDFFDDPILDKALARKAQETG
jgi:superfamily II DNA or RNA helicase